MPDELDGILDGRELTGQRLGPCAVESLIGCGGMGSVWLATHLKLRKKVAVKVLSESLSRNVSYVKRFVREAEALAQLDHPNIAGVLDFGEDRGFRYIVMQYVQGESVRERISRRGRMGPAEAVAVLRDLLKALAYAHARGFIHRDIKPSNILLDEQGNARLTDFGLVKSVSSVNLTMVGEAIGTPQYMSPEQWDGAAADPRMDIWSAGVTFYHLLTGNVPFEGTGPAQIAKSIALHTPKPLAEHGVQAPRGLQVILDRMLAKETDQRYATATAVLQDLNELSGVLTPSTLPVRRTLELVQRTRTLATPPSLASAASPASSAAPPALPSSSWKLHLAMLKVFVVVLILAGSACLGWATYFVFSSSRGEGKRGAPADDGGRAAAERERLRQEAEEARRQQEAEAAARRQQEEQDREARAAEARRKLDGLLADAATLRRSGRLEDALRKYTEALGLAPGDEAIKSSVAQVKAEVLAGKSANEKQAAFDGHCRAAAGFELKSEWQKAADEYRQALAYKQDAATSDKLNRAQHNALTALAEAAAGKNDYPEAEARYLEALKYLAAPESQKRLKEIQGLRQKKSEYRKALDQALELEKKAGTAEEWSTVAKAYRSAQELAEDKTDSTKGEARAEGRRKALLLQAAYDDAMSKGDRFLADGKWKDARTEYLRAQAVEGYSGSAAVARQLEAVKRAEEQSSRESALYSAWPFDAAEAKRRQKETAAKLGAAVERSVDLGDGVKLELVLIPAGEFDMGSPEGEAGRAASEGPVHRVKLAQPFWMGKYEVTQEAWERVTGANPSGFKGPRNPVELVSWDDCQEFLKKLNALTPAPLPKGEGEKGRGQFRLPTEAEWEYACRAGTKAAFSFGETIAAEQANCKGSGPGAGGPQGKPQEQTAAVGSFPANAWGLHDMHGNVLEWCSDWYEAGYYQKSPQDSPAGPNAGSSRVVRGGSWSRAPAGLRSAGRDAGLPGGRSIGIGLRVVQSVAR